MLAAAVRAEADLIVTFNLKDFPPEAVSGRGIDVVHPDTFLTALVTENPVVVIKAVERGCAELKDPPQTALQFLASLASTVRAFADTAAGEIR